MVQDAASNIITTKIINLNHSKGHHHRGRFLKLLSKREKGNRSPNITRQFIPNGSTVGQTKAIMPFRLDGTNRAITCITPLDWLPWVL